MKQHIQTTPTQSTLEWLMYDMPVRTNEEVEELVGEIMLEGGYPQHPQQAQQVTTSR